MMEPGTTKAYLPYVYNMYPTCWVWHKWKLMRITVVNGWQREDYKMIYIDDSSHAPGSLLLSLVCKTMVCDFVAHHSSEISDMVVTAV